MGIVFVPNDQWCITWFGAETLVVVKYKREDNVSVESVISKYIVEPKICSVFISKGGWI